MGQHGTVLHCTTVLCVLVWLCLSIVTPRVGYMYCIGIIFTWEIKFDVYKDSTAAINGDVMCAEGLVGFSWNRPDGSFASDRLA